ncbi:OmpA family protein [Nonomuraea jiangxiensis]|uniref:Outer membrane protein OmpA n=1 Tax=Nonomuraea jiangxiensis TaxID=633440 RepID=A0A1G8J9Y0_9ACTN|nr:OmpA family protein [Nonomuraea jiangxiensis]SDI27787.1 Outer membrane protein OmpA [Nonomuraea jiangxiensis]
MYGNGHSEQSGAARTDVLAIERTAPDTVTARLRITVERGGSNLSGFSAPSLAGQVAYDYRSTVAGIFLYDDPRLSVYFPMRDKEGMGARCLCSFAEGTLEVTSEPLLVWAVYRVPAQTTSVAVGLASASVSSPVPIIQPGAGSLKLDGEPDAATVAAAFPNTVGLATNTIGTTENVVESPDKVEIALNTDVLFAFDKATLTAAARDRLRRTAEKIRAKATGTVTVVGHTDDVGSDTYNLDLSRRRAQAVEQALSTLTGDADLAFQVDGKGESLPRVSGTSKEARAANRRVEVVFERAVTPSPAMPTAAPEPRAPGEPVTTAEGLRKMAGVTADLLELRRLGPDSVLVSVGFRNTGSAEVDLGAPGLDEDRDRLGVTAPFMLIEFFWLALTDAAQTRYVALSAPGAGGTLDCVCTSTTLLKLAPGQQIRMFALVSAPPPDVRSVDVNLFSFRPMNDVPVT